MNLTIQILVKNNNDTIEKCIKSLLPLQAKLQIVDIGATDNTIDICNRNGIKTEKVAFNNDYAKIRNTLLNKTSTHWKMYIEPYEFLASGLEEIKQIVESKTLTGYYFKIAQGTIISKEIRLWSNDNKFVNPVYETLKDNYGFDTQQSIIYANQAKIDLNERMFIVDKWKLSNPASPDPYYYQALTLLMLGNYEEFSRLANHYLFRDKLSQSSIMIRYYLAMVQAYHLDDIQEAVRNTLTCISKNPLMAEFWCLLGDIHYKIKQYKKSMDFYENAIILGNRRLQSDKWPMDVIKYKEHPQKMIESANKIIAESKIYRSIKT